MGHLLTDGEKRLSLSGEGRAPIRQLDPRGRILAALGFAVVVTGLSTLGALTVALAAAGCALALSGLPAGRTLKRMAMMDGFVIFMLVLLPVTTPGTPIATLPGGFVATREGLLLATQIALTANAVILMLMVLVGTLSPVTLGHALARLRVPPALVQLLLFTVRYLEVLRDEYARARVAMRARAFRPGTNRHSWVSLGHLVGMMLVRALERSERILQAMKCRGYAGAIPLLDDLAWRPRDGWFAAAFTTGLMALIGIEVTLARLA